MRLFSLIAATVFLAASLARGAERPALVFPDETFAFSNDTVFAYGTDERGRLTMQRKQHPPDFSHRCFVLCRSALQFHKFARFDPQLPRVSAGEYRKLVRRISRIPVWLGERPEGKRISVPGYASLHEFSRGNQFMMKEEMGNWLPTYLRVGNWRIIFPMPRSGQEDLSQWLVGRLERRIPTALFLVRFPHMNHVVVAFDYHRERAGDIRFEVYDPNYPGEAAWVRYLHAERSFEFEKRWYFTGGRINALRTYISPFH